jgi:hypothetical protein
MGVLTPKRAVLFVVAVLFGTGLFAANPSPRQLAAMAWDKPNNVGVLFGGRGAFDGATGVPHDSDETWLWNGSRWVQRFPAVKPPHRNSQSMVFDAQRERVIMFGGRQESDTAGGVPGFLGDSWSFRNDAWTRIESTENPPARSLGAMAYDSDRDVVVLYGGTGLAASGTTLESLFDTWEFNGTQWTRVANDAPKVAKPIVAYDAANHEVIMMGLTENGSADVMYRYRGAAHTWDVITPATMPTCVNDGHLVYQEHTGRLIFIGGICRTATPAGEEVFEWDGTTWTKLTTAAANRGAGQATAYDSLRKEVVFFGGTAALSNVIASSTVILQDLVWRAANFGNFRPSPRSLATFSTDTAANTVWLFGGLDETSSFYNVDLWGYRAGQWYEIPVLTGPGTGCDNPLSTYDTDRGRLIVTCSGETVHEWDGTAWKSFPDLKDKPPARAFSSLVYDPNLKKTILFGGYNTNNYRNDTWSWNGTAWTEIKPGKDGRPPHRGLAAMWYDPLQKKIVVYGGLGRGSLNERITRYSDMWAFNGTAWAKLTVADTPGIRFGPQYAINPESGKLLLFGGLKSEALDEDSLKQTFTNDTWEWDGAASRWTRLETDSSTIEPDVRENGSMSWDPGTGKLVLYGGYAEGFYRSDVWEWTGTDWKPRVEAGARRRAVR